MLWKFFPILQVEIIKNVPKKQNYTHFEKISKTFFKKCIFRAFLKFYSTLPPLKQKVLPPLPEKSKSPPAGPFSTPLLPSTTVPKCMPAAHAATIFLSLPTNLKPITAEVASTAPGTPFANSGTVTIPRSGYYYVSAFARCEMQACDCTVRVAGTRVAAFGTDRVERFENSVGQSGGTIGSYWCVHAAPTHFTHTHNFSFFNFSLLFQVFPRRGLPAPPDLEPAGADLHGVRAGQRLPLRDHLLLRTGRFTCIGWL